VSLLGIGIYLFKSNFSRYGRVFYYSILLLGIVVGLVESIIITSYIALIL